jgi:hypothetical protein
MVPPPGLGKRNNKHAQFYGQTQDSGGFRDCRLSVTKNHTFKTEMTTMKMDANVMTLRPFLFVKSNPVKAPPTV